MGLVKDVCAAAAFTNQGVGGMVSGFNISDLGFLAGGEGGKHESARGQEPPRPKLTDS